MKHVLFSLRLILYFGLVSVPFWLKPAIAVSYDAVALGLWFFVIPSQIFLAYFLHSSRSQKIPYCLPYLLGSALCLLGILFFTELEAHALANYILLSLLAFAATRAVFYGKKASFLAVCELFFFAFVYFHFLNFTRSAPDIARLYPFFSKTLFLLLLASFFIHSLILYLAAFHRPSSEKKRRELLAFGCIAGPIFCFLAFLSPQDFVEHEIAFNEWNESPPPPPKGLEAEGGPSQEEQHNRNGLPLGKRDEKYPTELQEGGGRSEKELRPEGQQNRQRQSERQNRSSASRSSGQGAGPRLEGVPADSWEQYRNSSSEGKNGKQHAIMIVASKKQPVYAAEAYWGGFEEEAGLRPSTAELEPLNSLSRIQLLESWQDQISSRDDKREIQAIFFLSTIKQRVLPYRPYRIRPTIKNTIYHPFDLSYHVQSRISSSQPEDWLLLREISSKEKKNMAYYLDLDLDASIRADFEKILARLRRNYQRAKKNSKLRTASKEKYFEKIDAILQGFRQYRYKLGFDENSSIKSIHNFLTKSRHGDCTEFAHSAAILGRLAGVPSRVVIGYLASKDLQSPAHRGGVYHLRKKIKTLQDFPLDELYLVTNAHHHAWVQYWLPYFGWIDFESTAFAIPPKPEFDPNNQDVVIPMIEEEKVFVTPSFHFPWALLLSLLGYMLAGAVVILYQYRYYRQLLYWFLSKGKDLRADKAMQKRLLFALATEGYALKAPYQTTLEYSQSLPFIQDFAKIYTMLRFRENLSYEERESCRRRLRDQYEEILPVVRNKGFSSLVRRIFSLRNLRY